MEALNRYFLVIAYKGTHYHGWQVQDNATGVQAVMNQKLSMLLGEEIYCIGCGRTDTGVHASKYFLHFDTSHKPDKKHLLNKLNIVLPYDISVLDMYEAAPTAHARHSATERTYQYLITFQKSPFLKEFATFIYYPLDINAMNEAARLLLNYVDFEALSKINADNKHHLCNIYFARWKQHGSKLVFTITANRFLRGMVRVIVGTMLQIGKGKMTIDEFKRLIESKDRRKAGAAAPAEGLYLYDIKYPQGLLKEL